MTNLDNILKSRDITLPTKFWILKGMIFPVVMYGYESWTIKKSECKKLKIPWSSRRSNKSIPKEINLEYSLGGLMLKLKLQYFGHLMQRANSLEKTMMLGNIEERTTRGLQRMRRLDDITGSMDRV